MKVLFVSHYTGLGGAQKSLLALIEHLRHLGVEPFVLIPSKGEVENELVRLRIPYEVATYASMRKPKQGSFRDSLEGGLRKCLNKITAARLAHKFKGKFDLIHANSSLAFFGSDLKKALKIPLVWHLREFGDIDYPLSFIGGENYSRDCYESADALVAISQSIHRYYSESIAPNGKYRLIYNGVDESTIPTKQEESVMESPLRICIVGGITEGKNHEDLIKAVAELPDNSVTVDIIGKGDNDLQSRLEALAKEKGISSRINFLGQDNSVVKKLNKYDIGVVTSRNEAFGRIIIEYMLAGLAVIAADSGACPELIDNGQNGLLYEVGNSSSLASCLKTLCDDNELLNKLAVNGHQTALEKYTAKINAQNIYNLYLEIVSR